MSNKWSKNMLLIGKIGVRYIISGLAAFIIAVAVVWFASEMQVYWYMHEYNVLQRSDLANDYGFALLLMLMVPVFILSFIVSFILVLKKIRKLIN